MKRRCFNIETCRGTTPAREALRALAMAAAVTVLAVAFTWPLVRCGAGRGIVYTAFARDGGGPRTMVPGDHLQFLYHLWLAQDVFAGRAPPFSNPYEFNEGDDAGRRMVPTYYLPFSAFSAVAASLTESRAAGWNFAIWMSLWLTGLASWALALVPVRSRTRG